jgi:hypothetical protein
MVTLSEGVLDMRATHAQYLFQQAAIAERGEAQLGPIPALAATNHIIDCGKRELLVI